MTKILITPRLSKAQGYNEVREELDIAWARLLRECGLLAVTASIHADKAAYFQDVGCKGVILTGGNDLSCVNADELSRMRDDAEREIVDEAINRGLPILGVCRGMQFLGHYFGGALKPREGHVRVMHDIQFASDHPVFAAYDRRKQVNSFHCYELILSGEALVAVARSADGVLEAFTHRDKKIVGLMWHPERVSPFDVQDKAFIKSFFTKE